MVSDVIALASSALEDRGSQRPTVDKVDPSPAWPLRMRWPRNLQITVSATVVGTVRRRAAALVSRRHGEGWLDGSAVLECLADSFQFQ